MLDPEKVLRWATPNAILAMYNTACSEYLVSAKIVGVLVEANMPCEIAWAITLYSR
jgi:hypothetical protein